MRCAARHARDKPFDSATNTFIFNASSVLVSIWLLSKCCGFIFVAYLPGYNVTLAVFGRLFVKWFARAVGTLSVCLSVLFVGDTVTLV